MKRKKIDKSVLTFGIPERLRSKTHRDFIGSLPCCATLSSFEVEAAHTPDISRTAKADKNDDRTCVPLQKMQHIRQHTIGHKAFWKPFGGLERVEKLRSDLWNVTGDVEKGTRLIWEFYFGSRQ